MESLSTELIRQAWAAEQRGNFDAASALWIEIGGLPNGNANAFVRASQARLKKADFDGAEAIALDGLQRHPGHGELLGCHAWAAHNRGAWPEALRRWEVFHASFPDEPFGYAIRGVALVEMGRHAEADELYRDGLARFPDHLELLGNYAWSAQRRNAWEDALERWQAAHHFHPGNPVPLANIQLALDQLGRSAEAAAMAVTAATPDLGDPGHASLMMGFESLGGDCHFGIVQDRFGARPLGLLRFTATPLRDLIGALESGLEGIGDPASTDVIVSEFDEYLTSDTRFHMVMHTYVKRAAAPDIVKQTEKFLQRLRFLRRKMLDDLQAATKVFVYASRLAAAEQDVQRLWQQLQAFGPNRLLFVMPATEQAAPGTLKQVNDTLFLGSAAHFDNDTPDLVSWLRLCQQVESLSRPRRPASAVASITEAVPAES